MVTFIGVRGKKGIYQLPAPPSEPEIVEAPATPQPEPVNVRNALERLVETPKPAPVNAAPLLEATTSAAPASVEEWCPGSEKPGPLPA